MKRFLLSVAFVSLIIQFNGCGSDEKVTPDVAILPDTGAIGTIVTITGKGFVPDAAKVTVKFNGTKATVQIATETAIVAIAPRRGTTGPITVSFGTTELTGPVFTYKSPEITEKYYISFKVDGIESVYQTGNPGYQSCGDCACSNLPPLDDENSAGLSICFPSDVTATMIQSLKNKTLPITSGSPEAKFWLTIDGEDFGTVSQTTQTTNSKMVISEVVADGSYGGKKAFKVTGTFTCKISDYYGDDVMDVTEGKFVVRFTEW
jgi:hypothetical protein